MKNEEVNMDELELIETPYCWNCTTYDRPLYIDHTVSGDREKATTCLPCYKEEQQ